MERVEFALHRGFVEVKHPRRCEGRVGHQDHLGERVRLALERELLVFPTDLPLRDELTTELASIESAGGQSKHDDMAIALALALWSATRRQPAAFKDRAA